MSDVDWREEALIARAALYLLKVATARPDLPRVDAWRREHLEMCERMEFSCVGGKDMMCEDEWTSHDWRRDTLEIAGHVDEPQPDHSSTFRARVIALLDGP